MLEECISIISQFQREYFSMLIPDPIKDQWDELIETPGMYVKFCGAGGGGFFQVITTHNNSVLAQEFGNSFIKFAELLVVYYLCYSFPKIFMVVLLAKTG